MGVSVSPMCTLCRPKIFWQINPLPKGVQRCKSQENRRFWVSLSFCGIQIQPVNSNANSYGSAFAKYRVLLWWFLRHMLPMRKMKWKFYRAIKYAIKTSWKIFHKTWIAAKVVELFLLFTCFLLEVIENSAKEEKRKDYYGKIALLSQKPFQHFCNFS